MKSRLLTPPPRSQKRTLAGGGRPQRGKVTVNQLMAAMLQEDPTRMEWSAETWAARLQSGLGRLVSAAAVKLTHTWKNHIKAARALSRAERANKRRR